MAMAMGKEIGINSGRQLRSRTTSVSKLLEAGGELEESDKVVSFIKLLGRNFSQKLQIPEEFTKNFNGYTPHRFIIENATTNKCWRVEVEKDEDGGMYFGGGWGDFVEANVLETGNFLVFHYEEQSIFQVKIYGRNGCLKTAFKETNKDRALGKSTGCEEEEEIDAAEVEYKQEISKNFCQRKTTKLPSSNYEHGKYKRQCAADTSFTRKTKVSISENSVRFSITFHKTKNYQFIKMTLPKPISQKKKLRNKDQLVLKDAKGNCWPVKLSHKRSGFDVFTVGWKDFLMDNGVGAGDTLNFEFISDDMLRVDIARTSIVKNHFEEVKCRNEASGSLNVKGAFYELVILTPSKKENGASTVEINISSDLRKSFSVMWRNTTVGTYLHIPKAFAESQNLKEKDSVVLRDPQGKCWPLEVGKCDGRLVLTKGWPEFWKGHGITAGDSLRFEFSSKYLIQVTITRGEHVIKSASTNSRALDHERAITNSIAIDNDGDATLQEVSISESAVELEGMIGFDELL